MYCDARIVTDKNYVSEKCSTLVQRRQNRKQDICSAVCTIRMIIIFYSPG